MALPDNYKTILSQIKSKIAKAQIKTVLAANKQMLLLYWQIGNDIISQQQAQGWGSKIIEQLSKDLRKEFPKLKGFSPRNILYMKQFAEKYPVEIIVLFKQIWNGIKQNPQQLVANLQILDNETNTVSQQAVAKLNDNDFEQSPISSVTWSHHIILINKVKDYKKIFWYILNSIEHGISRNILAMQIESDLYARQISNPKANNFNRTLPAVQSDLANYLMKDPYIFDFVQTKEKQDERNIEEQLMQHITKFLLELGQGFALVGKQYRLQVGEKDFYIDLLFYHTQLHCYVVVELKAREFKPEDAGQLGFYISAVDGEIATKQDNPTIGLLLCKSKNQVLAEYSLKGYNSPIGVAKYNLSTAITEELKSQLPSIKEIENEIKNL